MLSDWAFNTDLVEWLSRSPDWVQFINTFIFVIAISVWMLSFIVLLVAYGVAGFREPKHARPRRSTR